ncbi:MAG: PEP/pyruvate-binding domain-containing protein [Myxococcota bacterium]
MNVLDLVTEEARSRETAGSKGAALAQLIHEGFAVPTGFVVTTHAFDALARATSGREGSSPSPLRLGSAQLPSGIRNDIAQRRTILEDATPGLRFAVRSSAVAEDTSEASFAGQYQTLLGVKPEELDKAIVEVWASAFGERATDYRAHRGVGDTRMAVVVQRMIETDTAGVCFTSNPITRVPEIVINANFGLGESVVGGHATPDTYLVDRGLERVHSAVPGDKTTETVTGPLGVEQVSVDPKRRQTLCLSDADAIEVARLALAVEARRGSPVDIEWGREGDRLWLLQARPITTATAPDPEPPAGWVPATNTAIDPRYPKYSNGNISEVLPGCVTPLSWDHTGQLIERAFLSQLRSLGAIDRTASPTALGFFFHRPYVNVSLLLEAADKTPGMTPDTVLEEFVGKPETRTPAVVASDLLPHRLPRLVRLVGAVLLHSASLGRAIADSRRTAEEDAGRVTADWLADATDRSLIDHVRVDDNLAAPSVVHVWASTLASVSFAQLRSTIARWLGEAEVSLASELVSGIEDLPSAKPGHALHALSAEIQQDPVLGALFREEPDRDVLLQAMRSHRLGPSLDRFLDAFGHRGVAEAELSRPCWRQDPRQVISLLQNHVRQGAVTPAEALERQRRARRRSTERLASLSWWRRTWLKVLTRRARAGLLNRETMKDVVIRRLDRSRRVYDEINRRMMARGLVQRSDDMFFLTGQEVDSLLSARVPPNDMVRVIEERRRDYRWSKRVAVPKIQDGRARVLRATEDPSAELLRGMGVSPGRITGLARVILDPRNDALIEPGEILVAPVTDVAWTPLFAQASGLVVEVGGLLSHGSIVAREYGIPAVVAVPGATRMIRTGDEITLDGAEGFVLRGEA